MLGWLMVLVTLTGVTLSANRNMAVGLVIGLAAAALVTRQRHRVAVMATMVAAVVAALVLLAQSSATIGSNPVVSRFASITNYSQLQTQTLDDRYYENGIALRRIHAHSIGGFGWGPDYGAYLLTSDAGPVHARAVPVDLDAGRHHRARSADRDARLRHLERGALLPRPPRARRHLAGCGSRRRGRRPGRELERRDLPDPARLDRAARGRARARGAPPARSDAKLSMAAGRQRDGMAGTTEPDAV